MKIGLAIAPHDAQPSAFVVYRDRLDAVIPKVAALGYDAVELALGQASDVDVAATRRLLDEHGLELAAVSTGRVFAEQRVWLTAGEAAIRERAVAILLGLVDLTAELAAPRLNIGRVRGPIGESGRTEAEGRFFDGIRRVADAAGQAGVTVVLEPVNRYEIDYVNSVVPDGLAVLARLGHPDVKLMPDVFHMNIEDASIADSLRAAGAAVGYVHLADSNRLAPGWGHTDFPAIMDALADIGYEGHATVEILPVPTPDEAATQAIRHLRTLVPAAA